MKTELTRNVLTLGELNRLKTKMDGDIEQSILDIVNAFEKQTQVALKKITISWNNGMDVPIKDWVTTELDLF